MERWKQDLDRWITREEPDRGERPVQSEMERLGIPGLSYVLYQYRNDVLFASTLTAEQKARRVEMIDAVILDFGEDE